MLSNIEQGFSPDSETRRLRAAAAAAFRSERPPTVGPPQSATSSKSFAAEEALIAELWPSRGLPTSGAGPGPVPVPRNENGGIESVSTVSHLATIRQTAAVHNWHNCFTVLNEGSKRSRTGPPVSIM